MINPSEERATRSGSRVAALFGALACAVATLTLAAYLAHEPKLLVMRSDWQTMSTTTAIICLLLGFCFIRNDARSTLATRVAGGIAIALSAAVLTCHMVLGHDALSPLIQGLPAGGMPLGLTSIATAGCSLLIGFGVLMPRGSLVPAILSILVMIAAGIGGLGYLYGVHDLYSLQPFQTMALRTAGCLFLFGVALLLINRRLDIASLVFAPGTIGSTTRRQLAFLITPPIAAWILLRMTSASHFGPGAAMAFLVLLTVAPLAALILRDSKALAEQDEQRLAKAELDAAKLAMEARYHTLFNSLETGFCIIEVVFDTQGKPTNYQFIEVNPAFARQTGLADAEGRWMLDLAPGHEQQWFDIYGAVAVSGKPTRFEQEADALGRHYEVLAFRIDAPEDRHVAIFFNDITARRKGEQQLRELNETLERKVEERAAALEHAQEALRQSQKLEAIGQLTGGVAHDFNNLLTVILGSVQMLRRPEIAPERHARYVDAIDETAQRAAKLTGQLLAFARRQTLNPEIFDVGASLTDVMGIVMSLTGTRIAIDLRIPDETCYVSADRSQFDTAVVNIALNARDAMSDSGQIKIACGPVSGIPGLRSHPPVIGDFIAVTIADDGPGIDEALSDRIFEPFFTTKKAGMGTGLGLSQVFGFAKQSGGDVRMQSEPGRGATFTVYLPRAFLQEKKEVFQDETNLDISGEGRCVLVVEDNAHVGEFATQALRELGYDTVLAMDATQALAILAEGNAVFDIVFSDVVMPGMSGLELGEEIRRLYPRLPVLLASGYSHVLAQNGTQGFELLHKPYSVEQLSRILRKSLAWAAS